MNIWLSLNELSANANLVVIYALRWQGVAPDRDAGAAGRVKVRSNITTHHRRNR